MFRDLRVDLLPKHALNAALLVTESDQARVR